MDLYLNQSSPVSFNKHYSVLSPTGVNDAAFQDVQYDQLRPNDLFKLLEDLQWKKAEFTLKQSPTDAKQWTAKTDNDTPMWRRLPIHQACIREPTPAIISALLDCFPASAKTTDNYDRTPLHCAIVHNAHIDVIFLILDAYYDAKDEKDFFGKTPKDYLPGNSEEIEAAFAQNKEYISQVAYKVRAKLEAAASHIAAVNNCNSGYDSPHRGKKTYHARAMESLLEEELAQARVEADAAYCERNVAMANNDVMRIRLQDLEEELRQKQEVIDTMEEMTDRNRKLGKLLNHLEKNNQTLTDDISEKENHIQDLKDKMKETTISKDIESKALAEKNQLVVEKLKATVGVLTTKLAEVTEKPEEVTFRDEKFAVDTESEVQSLAKYKAFAEEKIETLEEMAQAYKIASNDLQLQCISLEDQLSNRKSSGSVADAVLKVCMLEVKLEASERVKECLEKEIVLLASSNTKYMNTVEELEADVINFEIKVRNLEEGYYTMTSQLIERTRLLHDAIAVRGDVQEENKNADS